MEKLGDLEREACRAKDDRDGEWTRGGGAVEPADERNDTGRANERR